MGKERGQTNKGRETKKRRRDMRCREKGGEGRESIANMTDKLSSNQKVSRPPLPSPPPPPSHFPSTSLLSLIPSLPANLFPILCEEHIDITRAAVSTEIHPTTHSVSICACWTKPTTHETPVKQVPIISMVTTAVLVPTWHAIHGIVTLTHLCVRGRMWCVMCVCVTERVVYMCVCATGRLGEIPTL